MPVFDPVALLAASLDYLDAHIWIAALLVAALACVAVELALRLAESQAQRAQRRHLADIDARARLEHVIRMSDYQQRKGA
jgi:hypothetical protein